MKAGRDLAAPIRTDRGSNVSSCAGVVGVAPPAEKQWSELDAAAPTRNGKLHRVVDVLGALALLLLLLPAMLMIGVAIGTGSRGGVLYRQRRIGRYGREFVMLKFRTMYDGSHARRAELAALDDGNGMLLKIRRDPRVTPVGRLLRRSSLDELPQLLNVLRGEMSLVGPRPALPEEVARYTSRERGRLQTKPGMTGLWQVSGRADLPWEECVRLDLHYVRHAGLLLDMQIMLRTLAAVVTGRGAY